MKKKVLSVLLNKRVLSILLCLSLVTGLLPNVALAAGNTITPASGTWEALTAAFGTAQNGDTVRLSASITTGTDLISYILVGKGVTLDFNGHTIHYKASGLDINRRSGMFMVVSGGSLTLKGSGGAALTGNYSNMVQLGSGGRLIVESGTYSNTAPTDGTLVASYGGAVEVKGGSLSATSSVPLGLVGGTCHVSGGSISGANYALNAYGTAVTLSGGELTSGGSGVACIASGGSFQMTGGTIRNTGSDLGLYLGADTGASTISGGTIAALSGYAVFSNGTLTLTGDAAISSVSGMGAYSAGTLTVQGGVIASGTGIALYSVGSLSMTNGTVRSDSSYGLTCAAPAGKSATVSGGSIRSGSSIPAVNYADGTLHINGGSITTTDGVCAVFNHAAGTVNMTGGSLAAKTTTIVNNGTGTVKCSAGTIAGIVNLNAGGKIVIDGGSVKTIQGATPKNSAGSALSVYGITLTDGNNNVLKDTAVAAGEMTLTPNVGYGFSGVRTDAGGTVYLWLPPATTSATYRHGGINVSGGLAADTTRVLPNFTARVTVRLNGQTWNNPEQVFLSTSPSSSDVIITADETTARSGGVYVFSGLDAGQTYYVWGLGAFAKGCSGITVTSGTPDTTVSYHTIKVNAGEGIDYVFMDKTQIQGTLAPVQANVKSGYTFDRWANTVGGDTVMLTANGSVMMDGKKDITAYATLNTYAGSVTLNKDGAAWSASGKTVMLSPSQTVAEAAGFKSASTDAGGTYHFTGLSPLVTYSVWMDGANTGKTVTPTGKDTVVDYYSVSVVKGANIATVGGGGVYRKGTEITVTASVQAGDHVFSRWQNTANGALLSSGNPYAFTVNGTVGLTAVGAPTKYAATVTLRKDDAEWTGSPRTIVLSTSASELAGTVSGTVSGNTFTFSGLPATGSYYVWDADTVSCANAQIDVTRRTAALDYYTVTVSPDSNIAGVTGTGAYLKGSNVTLSATPKDFYRISGAGWTDGKYTINNIGAAQSVTPPVVLDTYTGSVTIRKDGAVWLDSGKVVTLSTSSTDSESGKLSALAALDPRVTYHVWVDGVYTGQVLSRATTSAAVDYYSVSVTKTNADVTGEGVYLAGSSVMLTATPSAGHDFLGWYAGGTLLSTQTTYPVDRLSAKQALTATATNLFSATVDLNGASGRDIKLSTSSANLAGAVTGTGSGPYVFSGLIRGTTYHVFDGSAYTGKTVAKEAPQASLRYYTVALAAGSGISGVSGGGVYLEGGTAAISATPDTASGYAFNGWSGTASFKAQDSVISNINKDYALTAESYKPYTGVPIDISGGSITITDSSFSGQVKVVQGGSVIADNISPSQAITITGTSTKDKQFNLNVNASSGATLMLQDLSIGMERNSPTFTHAMGISTSGNVTLILSGTNTLNAQGNPAVALLKNGEGTLTIQSIDGTLDHKLIATGTGICSVGIGNLVGGQVKNILINSGTVIANGPGAGIGAYNGAISGITVNGGAVTANHIGSTEGGGTLKDVIINGGNVVVGVVGAGTTSNVVLNGGSLKATVQGAPPTSGGDSIYKVTLGTGLQNTDVSQSLTIERQDGKTYSTKDMWTTNDASGNVYLWLPNGTYTVTLGTSTKTFTVNGAACSVALQPILDVNLPGNAATEGVTASVSLTPASRMTAGDTITVTVTLSGTARKPGTYTLGLTGTGLGTVAPQYLTVTKDQPVSTTKSFTFTMPAANVGDLAAALDFVETSKHTVRYMDGMTLLGSAAYHEGESYPLMDGGSLQKTGYSFGGWGVTGMQTMGAADVTRTAVWTPNAYKVVFHDDSSTTEQGFTYDAAAAALNGSFSRSGYSLSGWAATQNGPKVHQVGAAVQNLTVEKNGTVDLYAVWQAQSYTASFAHGGGTGTMPAQSYIHGVAQELSPNTFTRTGYTFTGWKDGATAYANGQSVSATADMHLTAQWTPNSYTVSFLGNGANSGAVSLADQDFAYDAAQELTANTLSRTGYSFSGWNTKADGTGTSYGDAASILNLTAVNGETVTLHARWTANPYVVRFDANGGTGGMPDQAHRYDTALALAQNAFVKTGYSHSGWNTKSDGSGTSHAGGATVKNLSAVKDDTLTLYAMWTADTYAVSFHANGGNGSMADQCFATGDTAALRANAFTKSGYSFAGWLDDKLAPVSAAATVDTIGRSAILTAQWTANAYHVRFHANGGTGGMADQPFTYGASQNLTANNNAITRPGYRFAGWSVTPTAAVATFSDSQSVSNLTAMADDSLILYAVWEPNTYNVSFHANGGTGRMADLAIENGESGVLSASTFTRDGYRFSGWNTRADGKGASYADGATVSFTPDASGGVTLYAMWTETVRYSILGTITNETAAVVAGADVSLQQGSVVIASTTTSPSGTYRIPNILPGLYNLVSTKDGKTVTTLVTVAQADVTANITLPSAATKSSVLVVDHDAGLAAPSVVVGGLDTLAQTENADISMTVTAKAEDAGNVQQSAIKMAAGNGQRAQFLDITLSKGADDIGGSNSVVLEIVQPFSFDGKSHVKVWRYHGGVPEAFAALAAKPSAPFTDATFFADSQNGLIHVYAAKFSTYAVSYQLIVPSSGGGSGNGGAIGGGFSGNTGYAMTVKPAENGTVKADATTAAPGTKVTVTLTPDTGYRIRSLTVTDAGGSSIDLVDQQDGTFSFTMPVGNVVISALFGRETGNPFMDVASHAYYRDAVLWARENGITDGVSATRFSPDTTCTRAQTVTFLWRALGSPEPTATRSPFTDVAQGAYYHKAVLWATEKGITLGTSRTTFSPEATVTRGQTVSFLWRAAGKRVATTINPFVDVHSADYYADAVLWAVSNRITIGTGAKSFSPVDGCTRAQIVMFLYRYAHADK